MEHQTAIHKLSTIKENINKVIIGNETTIELMLTAILADGHILLEDVPGTGKTTLAKALAKSMDTVFHRIQFTPDLLPSDVTGINYYNPKEGAFIFREGPIFSNIVLVDEINRATPRTQSSLLECMEEKQVTIDGTTYPLQKPFFVIATQNPIESGGTFPLPEAQLDRFLLKLCMNTPEKEEELLMMSRFLAHNPLTNLTPVCSSEEIIQLQMLCKKVYVHPELMAYIQSIIAATRTHSSLLLGASPRATLALLHATQAYALVKGREYVIPEDIKSLAIPVLSHRLILGYKMSKTINASSIIEEILNTTSVPTEDWGK